MLGNIMDHAIGQLKAPPIMAISPSFMGCLYMGGAFISKEGNDQKKAIIMNLKYSNNR